MTIAAALMLQAEEDDEPGPVTFSSLVGTLAENYVSATQANVSIQQTVLTDAVKLPVTGQLAAGAWPWNSSSLIEVITSPAVAAVDRVAFYQQILPSVCQINYTASTKNYTNEVPNWAQYVIPNPFAAYWVYWISFTGETDEPPSQLVLSDLFYTCGVSQADFFLGVGPWANIPLKYDS